MNGYVLVREPDGLYVAPPGLEKSYTGKLQDAQVYKTREEAERNKCGNERVLSVAEAMNH